jgi:hypothetical protein
VPPHLSQIVSRHRPRGSSSWSVPRHRTPCSAQVIDERQHIELPGGVLPCPADP